MTPIRPPFPSVFDSSLIAAFRSCFRKGELEFIQHFRGRDPSVHLVAGAAYAAGLEGARTAFFSEGRPKAEAEAIGLQHLMASYGDFQCPPESAKSLERTAGALEFYYDRYPLESDQAVPITLPGGRRGIELNFVEPIDLEDPKMVHPESGDPLLYCGRADEVVNYQGMILGLDDKTTSQLGASWPRQWDLRCFSEDHEVYTKEGWVSIGRILPTTQVLQSDSIGNLSFALPLDIIKKSVDGEPMVCLEGRRVSQRITRNHRVLLNRRRGGTVTVLAEDLHKQDDKHTVPLAGRHKEERLPKDIQRLVVAIQADAKLQASSGRVTAGRGHRTHMPNRAINFGFTKERKVKRLRELLTRLGVEFKDKGNERNEFYISGFTDIAELVDMLLDDKKDFKAGYETLFDDAFLDELEHWDGWQSQYYTNSENNARFVATIAALNDRAASVSCDNVGHWTVVLSHDTQRTLKSLQITGQSYCGDVYCLSVPEGYLLTRRCGEISISGNSQFTGYSWGFGRLNIKLNGWLIRGLAILKTQYNTMEAITYRETWQIERWHAQLKRDIIRIRQAWETGQYDYNLDHACAEYGGCGFRQVCLMKNPQPVLEQSFARRRWDPVRRLEIPIRVDEEGRFFEEEV